MKKRDSAAAIIIVAFLVPFFVFQINFFSKSRLSSVTVTHPIKLHQASESKSLALNVITKRVPQENRPLKTRRTRQITCDRDHKLYDICKINGPTVLDSNTSTFFLIDPTGPNQIEKIRPYPRKFEKSTMSRVKELTLISGPKGPPCQVQHKAPALVFSAGGYTGNLFHEFNDGFIPLFITMHSIFYGVEPVLVISKARDWWVKKYIELLRSTSTHPIINLDNETSTHCFPSANLGLISHGFMTISPKRLPKPKTLAHFRNFLERSYKGNWVRPKITVTRPRLVLVSRASGLGRVILNQEELKEEAERVGFEVVVFEPTATTELSSAYELINSSHAMVGVHGAALTHSLFLRPRAVFIQVVPLGTGWVSEVCFGKPAREMGLRYREYRIGAEESSLIERFGKDEMIIKDPVAFRGNSWNDKIMDVYLKEQNVRLDLVRFRSYLKEAYRKSRRLMVKEG
ncbi:hypothetical protein UlMin_041093 [Ulmus minor]